MQIEQQIVKDYLEFVSVEDIKKNLDILPIVLKWFQSINIEKLSINDNIVKIVLNKDILSVENKFFLLDSKIDVLSKEVLLDINNLYLKDIIVRYFIINNKLLPKDK